MWILLSASSSQKSSRALCGWSLLEPAIIAPLIAPIDVPEIMSNLMFFLAKAFITPQAKAPKEPPPCNTRTFSAGCFFVMFPVVGFLYDIGCSQQVIVFKVRLTLLRKRRLVCPPPSHMPAHTHLFCSPGFSLIVLQAIELYSVKCFFYYCLLGISRYT